METYHVGLISLGFFGLLGVWALLTWRRRIKKQESLLPAPRFVESFTEGHRALYVATTFAGRPLDRVIAHGLAHRGYAFLALTEEGLAVSRTGEQGFLIPRADLVAVSKNSAVIDRAVEKDGLISIAWTLGGTELETHFRFVDVEMRTGALNDLRSMIGV